MKKRFIRGDQVVYCPPHITLEIDRDGKHLIPGASYGFVTSGPTGDNCYFVRYWIPGNRENPELRTKANSEKTPADRLLPFPYTVQENVIMALKEWC